MLAAAGYLCQVLVDVSPILRVPPNLIQVRLVYLTLSLSSYQFSTKEKARAIRSWDKELVLFLFIPRVSVQI